MQTSALGALRHVLRLSTALVVTITLGNGIAVAADTTIGPGQNSGTVALGAGDSLSNSGTITDTGNAAAVRASGNAGTITNTTSGTIQASGNSSSAIDVAGSATAIVNAGRIVGSATATTNIGVYVSGALGSFANTGSITTGVSTRSAIVFGGPVGSITNATGATIASGRFGLQTIGIVDQFSNAGTITGDSAYAVFFGELVRRFDNSGTIKTLNSGGTAVTVDRGATTFVNSGSIIGSDREALLMRRTIGSFTNSGTIATASTNATVKFEDGANVALNAPGGTITNTQGRAVEAFGQVKSFTNAGTISGATDAAVAFAYGVETFVNEAGGVIRNTSGSGSNQGAAVAINMSQTVPQQGGGSLPVVANLSFINRGTILGAPDQQTSSAVVAFKRLTGGQLLRFGAFENTGLISGNGYAVYVEGGLASFRNAGTIKGAEIAAVLVFEGVPEFINEAGGLIQNTGASNASYGYGVLLNTNSYHMPEVRSFINHGTILGSGGATVRLANLEGGVSTLRLKTFTNTGLISGVGYGVQIDRAFGGTAGGGVENFTNTGTIESTTTDAIFIAGETGSTVTNSGTLRGATAALRFAAGTDNRLNLLTGSQIYGDLVFDGTADTLDFSGFAGNALLKTSGLENVVAGNRSFVATSGNAQVAIIDLAGTSSAAIGASLGSTLQAITDTVGQNLRAPDTTPSEPNAYAATSRGAAADAAEQAVLTQLDTGTGAGLWGNVIGGFNAGRSAADPSSVFGGIVAGSHARLGSVTLGGLAGYVQSNSMALSGQQTMTAQTGLFGIYGTTTIGTVTVDASLIGGIGAHTSKRQFAAGLVTETATGTFTSTFVAPSLGIAIPVLSGEMGELSVRAAATYVGGVTSAYTETGSSMNLSVGGQTISLLDLRLGLEGRQDYVTQAGRTVTLTAKAGVSAQSNFGSSSVPVTVTNLNLGTTVATPGGTVYGVYGGFGVETAITDSLDAGIFADGSLRSDGTASGTMRLSLTGAL